MFKYTCQLHKTLDIETALSPCRGLCELCKNKKVNGYTNPDHVSNPFGYLYLVPMICLECSEKYEKCMWCRNKK